TVQQVREHPSSVCEHPDSALVRPVWAAEVVALCSAHSTTARCMPVPETAAPSRGRELDRVGRMISGGLMASQCAARPRGVGSLRPALVACYRRAGQTVFRPG